MDWYIHIQKPAGIEWERTTTGHRVTIRRQAESYYVLNPKAFVNASAAYGVGLSLMNAHPQGGLGLQALDLRVF